MDRDSVSDHLVRLERAAHHEDHLAGIKDEWHFIYRRLDDVVQRGSLSVFQSRSGVKWSCLEWWC